MIFGFKNQYLQQEAVDLCGAHDKQNYGWINYKTLKGLTNYQTRLLQNLCKQADNSGNSWK